MKGYIEKTIKVYNKLITAALGERKQHVHEMSIYIKQTEIGNYNLIKGYLRALLTKIMFYYIFVTCKTKKSGTH